MLKFGGNREWEQKLLRLLECNKACIKLAMKLKQDFKPFAALMTVREDLRDD